MYSIIRNDAPCAGKLFLFWGAFGLGLAAIWRVAHGNPVGDAAIWAFGLLAALGLLLGMREL
jgi:hypothetical protein